MAFLFFLRQSHIVQTGLKLLILPHPKCWDFKCAPLQPVVLGVKSGLAKQAFCPPDPQSELHTVQLDCTSNSATLWDNA